MPSLLALGLVLTSALLHALWNALLKAQRDTDAATTAVLGSALLAAVAVVPFAGSPAFPDGAAVAWAVGAGLCEGGYFVTLGRALAGAPLGLVYTLARGGSILAVWPLSVLLLSEPLTLAGSLGAGLLLAGLAAVSLEPVPPTARPGLAWAAACALCIAGYHLCYKCALAVHAEPRALFALSLGVALPINLAALGRDGRRRLAALWPRAVRLVGAGVICTTSFLAFLAALARSGAAAVLTLRNTSVVFALLLGRLVGEHATRRRWIGALLVVLGAALLGWPRA